MNLYLDNKKVKKNQKKIWIFSSKEKPIKKLFIISEQNKIIEIVNHEKESRIYESDFLIENKTLL